MIKTREYYEPLSNEAFEEIKAEAMKMWKEIDTDNDKYGYATEKINRIKDLKNIADNGMTIIAMFDIDNQAILAERLTKQTNKEITEKLDSAKVERYYNPFAKKLSTMK